MTKIFYSDHLTTGTSPKSGYIIKSGNFEIAIIMSHEVHDSVTVEPGGKGTFCSDAALIRAGIKRVDSISSEFRHMAFAAIFEGRIEV